MPWKECSVMDERLKFVARRLAGEPMAELCREFGISRKTGYKIFDRYQECGIHGLTDRSRRPFRYANKLPLILCGLTYDPRSGLASVLANVDIVEMQLKLFVKRIQVLGCCSDLAFGTKRCFRAGRTLAFNRNRPFVLRDYERRLF